MVFADSSGFIAAFDRRDARHAEAAATWREIATARRRLVTTQLVLAETVTYLRRRGGFDLARRVGRAILESRNIDVVGLDEEAFAAAWREFIRNPEPKLSLCDAASFVVMRERGLRHAFTLDHHFESAGFAVQP